MKLTTVFTRAVAVTATVFFSFLTACNPADLPQDVDNPNANLLSCQIQNQEVVLRRKF